MSILEKLVFPDQAVSAIKLAPAAGSTAEVVGGDANRECGFDRLDGSVEGVGHVAVRGVESGARRAGANTAGKRLIIGESFVAKGDIIHRPLAGRRDQRRQGLGQGPE